MKAWIGWLFAFLNGLLTAWQRDAKREVEAVHENYQNLEKYRAMPDGERLDELRKRRLRVQPPRNPME